MSDEVSHEKRRLGALNAYRILDTLPDETFDRLTRLAALICRTPISLVTLIDEKRQWFKSRVGLDLAETAREIAFCDQAIRGTTLFEVADAAADPRFARNPLVTDSPNMRFYAGFPLIDPEGFALGTLCVIDQVPRSLDSEQKVALALLAAEVMAQIAATRRYRELHALEQLFRMSPDLIGLIGTDGTFWKVNPSFFTVLGWHEDDLLGHSPLEFVHPDEKAVSLATRERLLQGNPITQFVGRFATAEGGWRTLEWVMNLDPATKLRYAIARDVTEQKAFEAEMASAKEQAQAANKAKSEFLATMSHEIRTPLNGVIGFSDILMKTPLDETQQQFLGVIHQSANSLLDIVSDILDFSKIEEGKLELELQENNLHETASQVLDAVSFQGSQKNLEMLLDLDPKLPSRAIFDSMRLRQVLVNLLGNAVKFTASGEIELRIRLQTSGKVGFWVRDTGVGIKPEFQQRIFEAFSQEDTSTTRRFGGTGLGLAISNRLLALMDSHLELESTPGVGTTFSFELALEVLADPAPSEFTVWSPSRVLLVDDNAVARRILSQMLESLGLNPVEASTTAEADSLLQQGRIAAVLLDQQMPTVSLLDRLAALPVVLLVNALDKDDASGAPLLHKLVKPVKMKELTAVLERILGPRERRHPLPAKESLPSLSPFGGLKVLIADDNALNVFLARTVLGLLVPGCQVVEAANGKIAVERFVGDRPDLILMDVQMPVLNGLEATREIRRLPGGGQVPIIALTAGAVKSEKEACLASGMNDYLSKPFVREDLHAALIRNLHSTGRS